MVLFYDVADMLYVNVFCVVFISDAAAQLKFQMDWWSYLNWIDKSNYSY